jgi:hypothetical protein
LRETSTPPVGHRSRRRDTVSRSAHRMGHAIVMDVYERPFLSEESETPLLAGMTFTDELSIVISGRFASGSRTSSSARSTAGAP